jgi:stress-induced morphogen
MNQSVVEAIQSAIESAIEGAVAEVEVGVSAGHYNVTVTSPAFAGKPMVQAHRLVYSAISHLMDGDEAAVHAIDRLKTRCP